MNLLYHCSRQVKESGTGNALSTLEFRELSTFEQDLERRPNERCCSVRAVYRVSSEGEAGANGLVDIDHWVAG